MLKVAANRQEHTRVTTASLMEDFISRRNNIEELATSSIQLSQEGLILIVSMVCDLVFGPTCHNMQCFFC